MSTPAPATVQVAVVTGASRGLGASAALHLARAGVAVVGTYRSGEDEAAAVAEQARAAGGQMAVLPLDVAAPGSYPAFVEQVRALVAERFGRDRVDALVNNAGVGLHQPYAETTEEQFDELFTVNVKAPFFLTQALLPLLADGGRVLNVSSGLARFTPGGYAAYASTKGAVEVLTRYQAVELGARGIRVNVLVPGATATDFAGGVVRDVEPVNRALAATVPLGRVGAADDIGRAVPALLSGALSWANGTRIELSGGQSL